MRARARRRAAWSLRSWPNRSLDILLGNLARRAASPAVRGGDAGARPPIRNDESPRRWLPSRARDLMVWTRMHGAHELLTAITVVLCCAAVTTVVFQRLRQPVVLGYLLAGLIVGPHVPIPLIADREIIQTLSELGVILLMFALGLEFSLRKLVQVGPTAGLTAIIQSSIMVWLGFIAGRGFGWTPRESIFAGAIIAISSTTIIAKAFDEQGVKGKLRDLVVGVLIVEDLIGILLMAVLTAVSSGQGMSAGTLVRSSGQLVAFLVGL